MTKTNSVLLLSDRANTDDPSVGKLGPGRDGGVWWILDRYAPGWEEFPARSLLYSLDDDADPTKRARTIINRLKPMVVVAFGRNTAKALGLSGSANWFEFYQLTDGTLAVIVPHPTPLNRRWNDKAIQRKMRKLFRDLADPTWLATAKKASR